MTGKVTGLGGAFVRVDDPKALVAWYETHLGITSAHGSFIFPVSEHRGDLVLSFFKRSSDYFPVAQPVMLNLQVDDLDAILDRMRDAGVEVEAKRDSSEYGRFGWFTDPGGNRVELWQAPD